MALSLLTMTTDNLQHVENHMLLLGRKNSRERVAAERMAAQQQGRHFQ